MRRRRYSSDDDAASDGAGSDGDVRVATLKNVYGDGVKIYL